jgi:hypothetical protein
MAEVRKHSAGNIVGNDDDPPRNRPTNTQRRTRLDEINEMRCQLDEELANLHQEIGRDEQPSPARASAQEVHQRIVDDV